MPLRLCIWLCFAIILCWPVAFDSTQLLGDPQIDVWNHAWGYWYVYQSLAEGTFPLETMLVGAPRGGSLYFIDTPGAIMALPLTWAFGPTVGYNWILIVRIALAGVAAQLLAEELSYKGFHSWVAGVAYAASPFLLCELKNGISEVCAIEWIAFSLWAAARVLRTNRMRDWLLLGLMQGLSTTATFYYGLAGGILLTPLFIFQLFQRTIRGQSIQKYLLGSFVAVLTTLVVLFPHGSVFWNSIHRYDRLVIRDVKLHDQLLRHNAVDPSIYIQTGAYQSVDLLKEYGEPFLHTGYLRWSVILLSIVALYAHKRIRHWSILAIFSLLMGMGSYLWFDGEWVRLSDGQLLSLPFDWLRQLLPQIAITHPLRLSIGAQALFSAFSAIGFAYLCRKASLPRVTIFGVIGIILYEGLFTSSAHWPIPTSSASISSVYQKSDSRAVLDLPAEVGTSMQTSRYFWYQTLHQSPIPYTPDVRLGSAKDPRTFSHFIGPDGVSEEPKIPKKNLAEHMKQTYGLIVLHPELDAELSTAYLESFTPAFGLPKTNPEDGLIYWVLAESTVPKSEATEESSLKSSEPSRFRCSDLAKAFARLKQGTEAKKTSDLLMTCKHQLSDYCLRWTKKDTISEREGLLCLRSFSRYPIDGDIDSMLHLLRRKETKIRLKTAELLKERVLSTQYRLRLQRHIEKERIPTITQKLQEAIDRPSQK
ncbi:MAG: hypothetical protein VX278_22070 [Myxococcota bacterium]|nr:hypothetical protein [Myxococcota bacterium]